MFSGSIVALTTPMNSDGSIAKQPFTELIEWHIDQGTDALVIAGTTGEAATLSHQEYINLLQQAVKQVAGRIPVIAGAGTNSTQTTLQLAEDAKNAHVDGLLIVTPYYNKPSQEGLFHHYQIVATSIDLPIILYNVPSRTGCDLLPETVERLSHIKHIIGIKEATGKLERYQAIRSLCGNDFAIYSGDDLTALTLLNHGANGVISVTANIVPHAMQQLCEAVREQNHTLATSINNRLQPLHQALFLESNPIPAKWALYKMNKIPSGIRLPLLPLATEFHPALETAMQQAGVNV
jgi:4-hydroxy-tetrahydrodipicolinate synthase